MDKKLESTSKIGKQDESQQQLASELHDGAPNRQERINHEEGARARNSAKSSAHRVVPLHLHGRGGLVDYLPERLTLDEDVLCEGECGRLLRDGQLRR